MMEISFKIPGVGVQTKGAPHVILKIYKVYPYTKKIVYGIGVNLIKIRLYSGRPYIFQNYMGSAFGLDTYPWNFETNFHYKFLK